ncbi:DUF4198 domain-containing protein [Pseudomonas sp. IT-347P]|uniref:hypothetical protein n=1 Tax=Pseudomonas sp. IT-347P TaxID=3026458 RepID=UPI0039E00F85
MTDQEKLSGQLTQVDASSKRASKIKPAILQLTDLDGHYIESGSTVEIVDFFVHGVADRPGPAQILDGGTLIANAQIDEHGRFKQVLLGQNLGVHAYTVRDESGRESSSWEVNIETDSVVIASVKGPDQKWIDSGSSTIHNELTFFGKGVRGQVVELLDNDIVLQLLKVNDSWHWHALLTGLKPGKHQFVARKLNGEESNHWHVEIEKPASLSIQFSYGEGNHQPINNGETTTQTEAVLVGTAKPYESGRILSDIHEGIVYKANEHGVFVAPVKGLVPGHSYRFVCRSESEPNRQSEPWAIKVASSKLPQP